MNNLILGILFFSSSVALAFPENVRFGYASCSSCHVSPGGGGVLSSYGKMTEKEILSSFAREDEEYYFLPNPPEWISIGGDQRYLNFNHETCDSSTSKKFLMQADLEAAIRPISGLTLVGSAGYYNIDFPIKKRVELEQRRNYALIDINKNVSFRIGRFLASYGLNVPDHTTVTRAALGFGEGSETYNIEGIYKNENGELTITGVNGSSGSLNASASKGYAWKSDPGSEHGIVARASWYMAKGYQIGLSGERLIGERYVRSSYGFFAILGFSESLYSIFEIDRNFFNQSSWVYFGKLALVPFKGVHLSTTYEGLDKEHTWKWAVNIFPRPHFELLAEYVKRLTANEHADEWIFVAHHYL